MISDYINIFRCEKKATEIWKKLRTYGLIKTEFGAGNNAEGMCAHRDVVSLPC